MMSGAAVAQEAETFKRRSEASQDAVVLEDCPMVLEEQVSIGQAKSAFACRQFADVVRALRDWNSVDPKERFDRLSLYIAALANTGRHAETLVTVRYALRFVRLQPEQMGKLATNGASCGQCDTKSD